MVTMEIIEIGAVRLAALAGPPGAEFSAFVRPVVEPQLSAFCMELTDICQVAVDTADPFPLVFACFLEWLGDAPYTLCSWGAYDLGQFRVDCDRHGVPFPAAFERHINLKQALARQRDLKPMGMAGALRYLGLPLVGQHHRGIDDARNIARIAQIVLPEVLEG